MGDKGDSSAESGLSIMIISSSGVLKNFNGLAEDKYIYTYSYEKGLEVVKKMATNSFNLIDEKWIPTVDKGLVSLKQVFQTEK